MYFGVVQWGQNEFKFKPKSMSKGEFSTICFYICLCGAILMAC